MTGTVGISGLPLNDRRQRARCSCGSMAGSSLGQRFVRSATRGRMPGSRIVGRPGTLANPLGPERNGLLWARPS